MRHLLFLDFETYYDNDYTLTKMTPAEYILDRRYETIMVAVKADDQPHKIVDGPDFPAWLSQFDPNETTTVTFNSLFDNAILAWRYGFVPSMMIDAMGMARALDGHQLSRFNLATISDHLGLPAKGNAIHNTRGKRRADLIQNPAFWREFCDYALRDNMNAEGIFVHYYPRFPKSELRLMDLVLRCCIEPRFVVNQKLLSDHYDAVVQHKENLLAAADGVDKSIILSTPKFKAALEALGVDIEYKKTPTGNEAPAFAKTDAFMERLHNDPDPAVAALATARLGLRSTLEETRSKTLLRIARLPWDTDAAHQPRLYSGGTMPIPLRYGGAHTHRLSGDWRMNMQNMPRGSALRYSLEAGPGNSVITCDLGQIEARLVAWICGCNLLLEEFANKLDPYNRLASAIFGRDVNRKLKGTPDEIMGFIGKTGILGLGYGCGKENFNTMVVRTARATNTDLQGINYERTIGDKAVDTYRSRYPQIPSGWRRLSSLVESCWFSQSAGAHSFGPVEISYGQVMLPNDLPLSYADPSRTWVNAEDGRMNGRWEYRYRYGNFWHRIYGAKLLENIVQALARIIVMNAALRIAGQGRSQVCPWAYRFVLQAHDELVFIVPDSELETAKQLIHLEMTRPPSWGKDIPLVADVGVGKSYGDAK